MDYGRKEVELRRKWCLEDDNLKRKSLHSSSKEIARDVCWEPRGLLGKGTLFGTASPSNTNLSPDMDEQFVDHFEDRIANSHHRSLYPLMEDLADWINKTLDIEYLKGSNLLNMLDNGVILWQLAKVIQEYAEHSGVCHPSQIPKISARCFKCAARKSFFARDNTDKFIQFCKKLGIHQHLLFESDDLVLQHQPRSVIICLLEVSRIATKFGLEPPGLVKFEREIDEEESQHDSGLSHDSLASWQLRSSPTPVEESQLHAPTTTTIATEETDAEIKGAQLVKIESEIRVEIFGNGDDREGSKVVNGDIITFEAVSPNGDNRSEGASSQASSEGNSDACYSEGEVFRNGTGNDLDKKVKQATLRRKCRCANGNCEKLNVKKVGEGRYMIAGRNVFVRLLKGRHMMVRVGGGWDTLENFLDRHGSCQSCAKASLDGTPSRFTPKNGRASTRPNSPNWRIHGFSTPNNIRSLSTPNGRIPIPIVTNQRPST